MGFNLGFKGLNFSLQCRKYGTCVRYFQLLVYPDNAIIFTLYTNSKHARPQRSFLYEKTETCI